MVLKNYWWLLIWMFLFGAISLAFIPRREEIVLGKPCMRWGKFSTALLALPYVIWAAWRTDGFGDTAQYRLTFNDMPTGLSNMWPYVQSQPKGPLFVTFRYLIKTLISDSSIVYFLIIAIVQMAFLIHFYRKYSKNYWLSFFLFVASTDYMSWMHNGIRQFLAATILLACIPLIAERRYFLSCVIALICIFIHSASAIFLPFIFVVNGKAFNFRTMLFIVGLIFSILFVDRVSGFIVESMENTVYESGIEDYLADDGTNILRVLFYSVPTIACWFFRDRIEQSDDPLINVCANLSVISAGIYLFSSFTSGIFVGAVPIYFSLVNYILIPWLIDELFTRESRLFVQGVAIAVYSFFFYYQMGPTWHLI